MGIRIARKLQKIFGSTAGATQIGKFGSLAAGSPAYTSDPVQIQSLANYLTGWFGAVIGGNSPAIEDMNALCYLYAYQLAYLMQSGMPEWDVTTEYFTGQFAADGLGGYYISLTDNNLGNPLSDVANWVQTVGPQRVGDFLVTGKTTGNLGFTSSFIGSAFEALNAGRALAGSNSASPPVTDFSRCNGTLAVPTAVTNGNDLFIEVVKGRSTGGYATAAFQSYVVDGVVSAGVVPAKWLLTLRNTAGALVERLRVFNDGIEIAGNGLSDPIADFGAIDSVRNGRYYEGDFNYNFNDDGFDSPQSVNVDYVLTGKMCTLAITAKQATGATPGNAFINGTGFVPFALYPARLSAFPCQIYNNTVQASPGLVQIRTDGTLRIYRSLDETATYTSGGQIGWFHALTFTYETI